MSILSALMRIYSYVFHFVFGLFLAAIAFVGLITSGGQGFKIGILPLQGWSQALSLLAAALFGIVTVILAVRGKLRILFLLWSLVVLGFLLKGYIFSSYGFPDRSELYNALYLIAAAILAAVGAALQFRPKPARLRRLSGSP